VLHLDGHAIGDRWSARLRPVAMIVCATVRACGPVLLHGDVCRSELLVELDGCGYA